MKKYILIGHSKGEFRTKGSIFSALATPVTKIEDVKKILQYLKKKFPDSNHICYGYRISRGDQLVEFSIDDGEPKGSSGIPILNVLKRNNLLNSAIFVIRYFGGTKLGIPGLINAYGIAAKNAIDVALTKKWVQLKKISFIYSYDLQSKIDSIIQKFKITIVAINFDENVKVILEIDANKVNEFNRQLRDISNGSINLCNIS